MKIGSQTISRSQELLEIQSQEGKAYSLSVSLFRELFQELSEPLIQRQPVKVDFSSQVVKLFFKWIPFKETASLDTLFSIDELFQLYHFAETYHIERLLLVTSKEMRLRKNEFTATQKESFDFFAAEYHNRNLSEGK
jgi:hypothetical protein